MKASEMTDEELANECESVAASMEKYGGKGCGTKLREAAARLLNQGKIIKMAHVQTRIAAKLHRRLKVAEDALEKITTGCFSHKDGDKPIVQVIIDIASNALFAIREE